jgi:hypothetical protein
MVGVDVRSDVTNDGELSEASPKPPPSSESTDDSLVLQAPTPRDAALQLRDFPMRDKLLATLGRARGNAFVQEVFAELDLLDHEQRHQEPGALGEQEGGISDVFSEATSSAAPKKSVPPKKKDRRPKAEQDAERSDNATYQAMNSKLKLLASEIHVAGGKLSFDLGFARSAKKLDKAQIEAVEARFSATIGDLDDLARGTAKQLADIRTVAGDPRLEDGALALEAALDELAPVRAEIDAWMTTHKRETDSWEVVGRSNGILKLVFPGVLRPPARPLTDSEKQPVAMTNDGIQAHLDAAIVAVETMKSNGPVLFEDRLIVHIKEIAALQKKHTILGGRVDVRIKELLTLVDQLLVKQPWMKGALNEATAPLRDVK